MSSGRLGINTLFLGGMVLVVMVVFFTAFLKSGAIGKVVSVGGGGSTGQTVAVSTAGIGAVLTGNPDVDTCTCYEQAYLYSSKDSDITSLQYQTGYSACRQQVGEQGGNAWSSGWYYGTQRKMSQRSCRFYMNSQKG